jgi:hypothetical protein
MDVLEKMSTQMVLLEKIEFWGSMDLDRIYYVKRWKHLESMLWVTPISFSQGDRELDMMDLTAIVLGHFGDLAAKPNIVVKLKQWNISTGERSRKSRFMFGSG